MSILLKQMEIEIFDKNKRIMSLIKKLKELINDNPDFASVLEAKFPELQDTKPYIYTNQFIMRTDMDTPGLYQLKFDTHTEMFVILNLKHETVWSCSAKPSNYSHCISKSELYLTKTDLINMMKGSSVNFDKMLVLKQEHLTKLKNIAIGLH